MTDQIKAQEALEWLKGGHFWNDIVGAMRPIPPKIRKTIHAALTADSQTQGGDIPMGAIENGRAFMERVEAFYSFRDEQNNPLRNCVEWQEFCICFMNLAEWAQHSTRPSPPEGMALVPISDLQDMATCMRGGYPQGLKFQEMLDGVATRLEAMIAAAQEEKK